MSVLLNGTYKKALPHRQSETNHTGYVASVCFCFRRDHTSTIGDSSKTRAQSCCELCSLVSGSYLLMLTFIYRPRYTFVRGCQERVYLCFRAVPTHKC